MALMLMDQGQILGQLCVWKCLESKFSPSNSITDDLQKDAMFIIYNIWLLFGSMAFCAMFSFILMKFFRVVSTWHKGALPMQCYLKKTGGFAFKCQDSHNVKSVCLCIPGYANWHSIHDERFPLSTHTLRKLIHF